MSAQGYYQQGQPQYPQQSYGPPQGNYGPPQQQYGGYPPQQQMGYQQQPPQQQVVYKEKKDRGKGVIVVLTAVSARKGAVDRSEKMKCERESERRERSVVMVLV
nr:hypothetical protein B0A51_06501 [Rachicladosporium sp. CCFEE 5018]